MAIPEKYGHISFVPPSGVRREAEYGLKLRREYKRGGTAVGIARARDLSNGKEVSPSTVRRMKAFFDRHASDEKAPGFNRGDAEYPSNGLIANKLWGGPSGYSWAKKVVAQMNAADENESARSYSTDTETRSLDVKEPSMNNVERRYLSAGGAENSTEGLLNVEHRADPQTGEKRTYLVGYAAKFNTDSLLLGDFIERIAPTAFEIVEKKKDLEGNPLETRGLFNHDPNHLIGRFPNTMNLTVDKIGLKYEILLPESRKDLEESVARGDLKGSSFSFVVAEGGEKWTREGGKSRRLVTRIKALLDCGPVTYPAYKDASVAVAKRSYEQFLASEQPPKPAAPKTDIAAEMRRYQDFIAERRGDCGRNPDGTFASGNACGGNGSQSGGEIKKTTGGDSIKHAADKASGKYKEWKKGDHLDKAKEKDTQEFLDKAREEQLSKGGKDEGKADEGGGVQTWSKGEHFPWTAKQVGDDEGYVQGQHPDGSKTEKYPFKGGKSSEAYKKVSEEIKSKPKKRSVDPRQVVSDTLKFLKDRR